MCSTNQFIYWLKMRSILILLWCLLTLCLSLKVSEAGVNDWHLQNIGEITNIQYLENNKIFFFSKLNIFGQMDKNTGKILHRGQLAKGEILLHIDSKQFIISTANNQIISYQTKNMEKLIDIRFIDEIKTLGRVRGYFKDQNKVLVVGEKQLRRYQGGLIQFQILSIAREQQRFMGIISTKESKTFLISQIPNKICFSQFKDTILSVDCHQFNHQIKIIHNLGTRICIETVQDDKTICFDTNNFGSIQTNDNIKIKELPTVFQGIPLSYSQNGLNFINGFYSFSSNSYQPHRIIYNNFGEEFKIQVNTVQKTINILQTHILIHSFKITENHDLLKIWINQKTQLEILILIQYTDMQLAHYRVKNYKEQLQWIREESLAYISKVLFMKSSRQKSSESQNQYHRIMMSHEYQSLSLIQKLQQAPIHLISRINHQLIGICNWVISFINDLPSLLNVDKFKNKDWMKFKMSEAQERKYGLRKNIIVITKYMTMFSIDTKTGTVLWRKNINFHSRKIIGLIKLYEDYQEQNAIILTYVPQDNTFYIDKITDKGFIVSLKQIKTQCEPTIHILNHYSILIKTGNTLSKFTLNAKNDEQTQSRQYYFYTIEANHVKGWKQINGQTISIWNIFLSANQTLIKSVSSFNGDRSKIPLVDQDKVIFKNVDFTNFAILTRSGSSMNLYVVNGQTGHIQFNQYQVGVSFSHPINLIYDENNILITYFSIRNRVFQIWTVEQYQDRIQNSIFNIIKQYFIDQQPINPTQSRKNIIFQSQVYGSTVPIKHIYVSQSKDSLIRRNVIVITPTNQLYSIRRDLISARRPKDSSIFSNQNYLPYDYLLPLDSASYLTYTNSHISTLNQVRFSPSEMQSTIFMLAYGVDVFMTRNSPDRTLDMITDDFNYIVILAVVIGLTAVVYFLKVKVSNAKKRKQHLQ